MEFECAISNQLMIILFYGMVYSLFFNENIDQHRHINSESHISCKNTMWHKDDSTIIIVLILYKLQCADTIPNTNGDNNGLANDTIQYPLPMTFVQMAICMLQYVMKTLVYFVFCFGIARCVGNEWHTIKINFLNLKFCYRHDYVAGLFCYLINVYAIAFCSMCIFLV